MKTIANYLFVAASSGFYGKKEWQGWADNQIMKNDKVEDWIYSVSLARDIDELSEVLGDKIVQEDYYVNNGYPPSDAVIGYYYIDYLEGRKSIYELLEKSGAEADGGEASKGCEEFYNILNKLEKNKKIVEREEFIIEIRQLFEPFKEIAEQQKKVLEEY